MDGMSVNGVQQINRATFWDHACEQIAKVFNCWSLSWRVTAILLRVWSFVLRVHCFHLRYDFQVFIILLNRIGKVDWVSHMFEGKRNIFFVVARFQGQRRMRHSRQRVQNARAVDRATCLLGIYLVFSVDFASLRIQSLLEPLPTIWAV